MKVKKLQGETNMGTTAQKLSKVLNTKNEIKDILLSKGAIEETTPFGDYLSVLHDIFSRMNY